MRYYHFDEIGSTRLITDSAGSVTDKYDYDAYGAVLWHERHTGSVDQPYQYAGRFGYYAAYQEPDFGLMQLGMRFYDPQAGRFTQEDPKRDGTNWYVYVDDRATLYSDALGTACRMVNDTCVGTREVSTPNGKPFTRWVAVGGSQGGALTPGGTDLYIICHWDEQRVQRYRVKEYLIWDVYIYCTGCYSRLYEYATLTSWRAPWTRNKYWESLVSPRGVFLIHRPLTLSWDTPSSAYARTRECEVE